VRISWKSKKRLAGGVLIIVLDSLSLNIVSDFSSLQHEVFTSEPVWLGTETQFFTSQQGSPGHKGY
jgi:hypothetical protein